MKSDKSIQKKKRDARIAAGGTAIVGGLGDGVRKVHSLAEHVARGRGLGRGDAQALPVNDSAT